ncbi:MAG: Vitamin B12 transporter BtuB [Burkholderiaceae bacterium]|nr:Vitamin B12 transporter BtuB [Burkholderiaceae bacterium]
MFRRSSISLAAALAVGGFAVVAPDAWAQDSGQRVEVTGSRIKRADTETAAPVQIMTREDIERTGKTSIQDVLRSITADSTGSIPTSFTNGFASGSAAVSLRGLGVNSTLVLVNGRRMSTYGLADDGTRNFVDLNSLPLEAVERIEVLKDGASAIYGADAVGGVVNVILRKNYTGASIGASYGQTGKSDGQTTRVFGAGGFGNLDSDKYNVFFTAEASKQKNIWSKDRGFIGQSDLRSLGYFDTTLGAPRLYLDSLTPTANSPYAVTRTPPLPGSGARVNIIPCDASLVDPTTGVCRYNGLDETEVQPEITRFNLFGRGTLQISSTMQAYAELGYFNTVTKSNGTLGANNDSGVFFPGDLNNPLVTHTAMILPAAHPDNTFGVDRVLYYRPYELGGRDQKTDNKVFRSLLGLQGSVAGWDYDAGLLYVKSKLTNTNTGFIIWDRMQAALNNGTYLINRPSLTSPSLTSAAVLADVSPALVNKPTSSVASIDAKVSRELMSLQGGPLGLALGAEARWEKADTPPVPFTDTASVVGLGYSAFNMSRNVQALYGELNAPVTKWLELNAALRYDHYSDFGNSTTPKLGFKARAMDQLSFRGTYAEAFRAPGPAEVGGSSFGFTSYGILSQGNPNIQPEKAKSYTLGVIAEPVRDFSATLDWWRIDRKNEIVQADPNSIIPAGQCVSGCDGSDASHPNLVSAKVPGALPNTFLYYDVDGTLATVTGFYRNAAKTKTDGVDLEMRYRMNLGDGGKLTGQLFWTHVRKYERTDADGNTFEYAGTHGPLVQSSGTGAPKDRATFALTFERGPWTGSVAVNYVGPIKMIDHQGEVTESNGDGTMTNGNTGITYPDIGQYACGVFDTTGAIYNGCKLPSFTTWDVFGKWSATKNWDVTFSIQNLFDRKAPFDPYLPLTYGINYNQAWHQAGAVGRFFTLGARYKF